MLFPIFTTFYIPLYCYGRSMHMQDCFRRKNNYTLKYAVFLFSILNSQIIDVLEFLPLENFSMSLHCKQSHCVNTVFFLSTKVQILNLFTKT